MFWEIVLAARDPIKVTPQSHLEKESLDALDAFLSPWRLQRFDMGDDFGRDALAQVVEGEGDEMRLSKVSGYFQVKAHDAEYQEPHAEDLETRHLRIWADGTPPMIVATWSRKSSEFRFRTAREVVKELAVTKLDWEKQDRVRVQFRTEHKFKSGKEAIDALKIKLVDECDAPGGVEKFHEATRRVLLTSLIWRTVSTSVTATLVAPDAPKLFIVDGTGWTDGDIDPRDVAAKQLLAGAFLVFEQVWILRHLLKICAAVLPAPVLQSLLERRRLVVVEHAHLSGFSYEDGRRRGKPISGELGTRKVGEKLPPTDYLKDRLAEELRESVDGAKLAEHALHGAVLMAAEATSEALSRTKRDLEDPRIRDLLGLSPHRVDDTEPIWDAFLVNRLSLVNSVLRIAQEHRLDVVDFEGGLSRVAAEKHYRGFGLDRLINSLDAFDATLRAGGFPDVGSLVETVGLEEIIQVSETAKGKEFRDWFWNTVADACGSGGSGSTLVANRLATMLGKDPKSLLLPIELKLRFCQKVGDRYVLGALGRERVFGFETRSVDGDGRLATQRRRHSARRIQQIADLLGRRPDPYELCPCESGAKFRFCCGRPMG